MHICTYNVCYPIGAYVYRYIRQNYYIGSVRNNACPRQAIIYSDKYQVKSYNHILFAFEVATATTDDSQNEHYQDHSKVIHNYNCLWTVSGLNQLRCRTLMSSGRSQTVFYSRLFALIAMFPTLK